MSFKQKFAKLMDPQQKVLNLPNLLSLLRVLLVPAFVATLLFMRFESVAGAVVPAIIYALTAITDALDGKIARKYGLVTDFGKFIDPLADKFMVIGALLAILTKYSIEVNPVMNYTRDKTYVTLLAWLVLIVLFRELAVTSMRLVVASKQVKVDLAANIMGKLKTVSQMVGTVVLIIEPVIHDEHTASYVVMAIMAITTIWSGINYLIGYLPYIAPKSETAAAPSELLSELPEAEEE